MVIFVFAASFFARLAGIQRNTGKRAGQIGLLVGQVLQCATQRQDLVDRLCTLGHGLVALTQQYEAMGQAGLCFANAIGSRSGNTLVGPSSRGPRALHFRMVMRLCLHLRAGANSQGCGYGGKRVASLHGISSKNTNLPRNRFRLKNVAWFQPAVAHEETPPIEAYRKRKKPARPWAPVFRPEPRSGKATVGVEAFHGLSLAGKTGNATLALHPLRPAAKGVGRLGPTLHWCIFPAAMSDARMKAHASMWARKQQTQSTAPPATPVWQGGWRLRCV
jgi:hypothetical protein